MIVYAVLWYLCSIFYVHVRHVHSEEMKQNISQINIKYQEPYMSAIRVMNALVTLDMSMCLSSNTHFLDMIFIAIVSIYNKIS